MLRTSGRDVAVAEFLSSIRLLTVARDLRHIDLDNIDRSVKLSAH